MPDTAVTHAKNSAPRRTRFSVHARVFAIAIVFGLGAYAVIQALIYVTRQLGWLDWLK